MKKVCDRVRLNNPLFLARMNHGVLLDATLKPYKLVYDTEAKELEVTFNNVVGYLPDGSVFMYEPKMLEAGMLAEKSTDSPRKPGRPVKVQVHDPVRSLVFGEDNEK